MSYNDYDKFKDKKKKKIFYNKERGDQYQFEASCSGGPAEPPMKQPIILAKPDRDKEVVVERPVQTGETSGSSATATATVLAAAAVLTGSSGAKTIMIKTRESNDSSRAVSPCNQKPPSVLTRKESDAGVPLYQIAAKPATSEAPANPLLPPPSMQSCVKLVDEHMQISDAALEFLVDQNDFLVVGIVGAQATGKSYVMSALAGSPGIFHSHTRESCELGGSCTAGVDMFVTPSRMVLLDSQPLEATSMMDCYGTLLEKRFPGEFSISAENATDLQSLQLAAFLLTVCHVVIVVADWTVDNDVIRCLLDAEMLKPNTQTTSADDTITEYFPHVLFVRNMATPSDFSTEAVSRCQEVLAQSLEATRLHVESGLTIATGHVMPHLSPHPLGRAINYFMLPYDDDEDRSDKFRGHPGFATLAHTLRQQILSTPRQSLTPNPISEKHWFHYASKTLDNVKKSSLFIEFSRFL